MNEERTSSDMEVETLHQVLVKVLPMQSLNDFEAAALATAKAVRVAYDELSAASKTEPRNPFEGYEVHLNLHTLADGSECVKGPLFTFRQVSASDECTSQ